MVDRGFIKVGEREVHFRAAGCGGERPLVMLHASPGSSRQLARLTDALASDRRVIAPDTPGNGDSSPLSVAQPEIADYANAVVEFLDANDIPTVDLYGSHTGAHIAVEVALLAPARVNKLVLDGLSIYNDVQRREMLEKYAPEITPDLAGAQLLWAFQYARDQALFFPWFDRTPEGWRGRALPSARDLHVWTVELLRSLETYHLGYRAAFRHVVADRLPLVTHRTLVMAVAADPLAIYFDQVAALLSNRELAGPETFPSTGDTASAVAMVIDRFLKT